MDILFNQLTKDISFTDDFDLNITDDSASEATQRLYIRFKTFARDLIWNESYGIDFINDVFGKSRPKNTIDLLFQNEIQKEEMVLEITDYTSTLENYTYSCFFNVKIAEDVAIERFYLLLNEKGIKITDENNKSILIAI